jgi:integrase
VHRDASRLTALKITKLTKPGRYGDGGGLVLQVSKWGTKSWLFRFARDGRERLMGLGPLHTITLVEARELATEKRKLLLRGIDPIEERNTERTARKLESARAMTFDQCAAAYIADNKVAWRNPKHRQQWQNTLKTYVTPVMGALPVQAIDTALVTKVLQPIWSAKPETASRIRGRIETVLNWAKAHGYRDGDNPARWKGHLDSLLPARSKVKAVQHHPALPYAELPAFMSELRQREGVSARALEWTILTCVRTNEAIGARWAEITDDAWTVPADRMKGGRDHRVPLCDRARQILEMVPREVGSDFIFPGGRATAPLSNMAMLELLRGMQPGLTVHGFRSTFRDWAAEKTNFQNHIVEMALAHVVGDKVEAAYRRGDLFEKRRRLMNDWARYCSQPRAIPRMLWSCGHELAREVAASERHLSPATAPAPHPACATKRV